MFFLRRVGLWIIDFRSETAELALPEKFAASGGACGGLTTTCGSIFESGGATGGQEASTPLKGSTAETKGS